MKKLLIAVILAAAPGALQAEQWQVLGTRPMGMGGAFVAVAQGPAAQYWNPGGLVKSSDNVSGMDLHAAVNAEFTGGIIKNASQIGDLATQLTAIQDAQKTGGAITPQQAGDFVKTMSLLADMNKPGKGALVEADGGVNFKFSKVALSVNNFTAVGVNPFIDTQNLNLGNGGTSSTSISFSANTNGKATPTDSAYATAANSLTTAMDTLNPSNNLATLLCGTGGCGIGIATNADLANALANYAQQNSIPVSQITDAAAVITQYAGSAAPVVDGALSGGSYTNNTSKLTLDAASFTEIAAGYAWTADKWLSGLSIGGNLKAVNGRMATTTFQFMNNSNTGDAFKNVLKDSKSTWAPAVDVGALWDVNRKYPKLPLHPRLGLVVRNVNSPKFDMPDAPGDPGGKYKLDRQARIGLALNPAHFWTIAADMDLTKNKTEVSGYNSRQLALGTEINIINRRAFNIPLRAGIMKNLADSSSKLAYTAGTGLNLLYMHFDVSGVVSSQKTTLDNSSIPTKVGVSASFGLLF